MLKKIIKENKRLSIFYFLFLIAFSAHRLVQAQVIRYDINVLQEETEFHFASLIVYNVIGLLYMTLSDQLSVMYSVKFMAKCKQYLNRKAFQSLLHKKKTTQTSDSMRIFSNDIEIIMNDYIQVICNVVYYLSSVIMGIIYLFSMHHIFAIYILATSLILIGMTKLITKSLAGLEENLLTSLGKVTGNVNNLIKNIPLIRIFRIESQIESQFEENNRKNVELYCKSNSVTKTTEIVNDCGSWFISLGMYVIGILLVRNKSVTISEMLAAVEASSMITIPIIWISAIIASLQKSKNVKRNFERLIDAEKETAGEKELEEAIETIHIKDLCVKYKEEAILNHFCMDIRNDDRVAILGKSGSGKSTLIKVLLRLIEPAEGEVYFNDSKLEDLSSSYLDHIAYIGQENFILNDTVLNNITMYQPYEKEKMKKALAGARLDAFIEKHGMDYVLDENVTNISGGERQRINIARAMYHGGELLIMDEAFSALDLQMAAEIQEELMEMFPMVISVMHKVDDRILGKYTQIVRIGE